MNSTSTLSTSATMSRSHEATMSFGTDISPVPKRGPGPPQTNSQDGDLFTLLSNKKIVIEASLVETYFFETFNENPDEGVAKMFQLLIDFSDDWYGFRITSEMVASMSAEEIMVKLEEQEKNVAKTGQSSARAPLAKQIYENYTQFAKILFTQCTRTGVAYEQDRTRTSVLLTQLVDFLGAMSLMELKCLRKTALLTGVQLNTILISETVKLKVEKRKTERLLNIASGQPPTADVLLTLDRLKERLVKLELNYQCLDKLLDHFYDVIYVKGKCCWDSSQRLASSAIVALSTWMLMYPAKYVTFDALVNPFGHLLCNGTALMRFEVLKALIALYDNGEVRAGLGLFTQHYVRFVVDNAMATGLYPEVTERVGMKAIALLQKIAYHFESCIHEEYDRRIFTLLYSDARNLSYDAGEYLQSRLLRRHGPCHAKVIQHVIQWIMKSPSAKALEPFLENVADSLINSGDVFLDWDCITKILLKKCKKLPIQLSTSERITLLQILVHAVKLSFTGQKSSYRKTNKAEMCSAKETVLLTKDELRAFFVPILPTLLSEFEKKKKAVELIKVLATALETVLPGQ